MSVNIVSRTDETLVLEVRIPLSTIMLDGEQRIEDALNEAGTVASGELLKGFDPDGSPIQIGGTKLTRTRRGHIWSAPYCKEKIRL